MSFPKYLVVHPAEISVRQRVRVVSWLANANGEPLTPDRQVSLNNDTAFIKTELFDNSDDAIAFARDLQEQGARFVSCQNESGESII